MIPTSSTVLADTCVSESTEKIAELSGAKEKKPPFLFCCDGYLDVSIMFEYLFLFCFLVSIPGCGVGVFLKMEGDRVGG